MTTRRSFLAGAASAAAGIAAAAAPLSTVAVAATPTPATPAPAPAPATPAPTPAPTTPPPPSQLASDLARSLQRELPQARLSDTLTAQIAGDIEGNFDIAKAFRAGRLRNDQEPDFAFFADPDGECA